MFIINYSTKMKYAIMQNMNGKRLLPIGIQDFEDLRKRGCIYVDKTDLIYKLATEGKPYFLSRPRRFGKSLLLSTMEAYFLGKKELFAGLALEQLEQDWTEYPVLKISFGSNSYETTEKLNATIEDILKFYENKFQFNKQSEDFSVRLKNLLIHIKNITGKQSVVLIDEYDKPILDALYTDFEEPNRQILRAFYSPLKDCDQYIKFLFITGITKVSHVNIFSGLNQLNDISLGEEYSSICGIAESELEKYFKPEIEALSQKRKISYEATMAKLALMYDGYHFSHDVEGVYNPFCILKCFYFKDFGSYWFETATPTFLIKTLQNQPMILSTVINGRKATENQFTNYDPDSKNMLPVIYQSGYLTIKDFEEEERLYTLDFPNREVEKGFLEVLLRKFVKVPDDDMGLEISNLKTAIRNKDIDRMLGIIKAAIADLPTIVKKDMCENYYESVTHLMFRMTGFSVVSELQSVCGRSDIILTTDDSVFIIELKMDKCRGFEEVAQQGLQQIDENGYSARFAVSGKKMIKVCAVFSSEGKGMLGWKTL